MNFPKLALKNRTITITVVLIAVIWGMNVFYTIPRYEDPIFQTRTCVVSTRWPGATAKNVEQLVTIPIEKAIHTLDEVRNIRSESRIGLSIIYVDLEQRGVSQLEKVWSKIRGRVEKAKTQLPQGVLDPQVDSDFGDVEAMLWALYPLYKQKYSHEDLRKYAKMVQSELNTIATIGRVQLIGVQQEVINLEISSGAWSKMNLTIEQLAMALQERNVVAPGGTLDTQLARYIVRLTGEFETAKQIEQVVLGSQGKNSPTYLRDMGVKVKRTYIDPPFFYCRYGDQNIMGEKCIFVSFTMKKGGDIVKLGKLVRKKNCRNFLKNTSYRHKIRMCFRSAQTSRKTH